LSPAFRSHVKGKFMCCENPETGNLKQTPSAQFVPTETGDGSILSAETAHELAAKGDLILIDIRTQKEWCRTGVPAISHQVTMEDTENAVGFPEAVKAEVGECKDTPVALICRSGKRSTVALAALIKSGFSRVLNVKEGVEGGSNGRGWLAQGLPVGDRCCCEEVGLDDCRC
jgi:rhodanese-related sulfurtransferase